MLDESPAADAAREARMAVAPALIVDFLQWLEPAPRPYAEVMERWRTSCPQLTVWEDAVDLGYVVRRRVAGAPAVVMLTPSGRRRLADRADRR